MIRDSNMKQLDDGTIPLRRPVVDEIGTKGVEASVDLFITTVFPPSIEVGCSLEQRKHV